MFNIPRVYNDLILISILHFFLHPTHPVGDGNRPVGCLCFQLQGNHSKSKQGIYSIIEKISHILDQSLDIIKSYN